MIRQLWTFRVTGSSGFPVDMLRYDRCWPHSEGRDSVAIAGSLFGRSSGQPREVRLVGLRQPTSARWASFGWQVEFGSIESLAAI